MTQSSSESKVIDSYFQFSLYFLVVTGFLVLASTGKLAVPALIVVSLALFYRGYLLIRGHSLQLPERWASYLTLVYVAFFLCDLFFLSGSFVSATVHLLLFVMVVKMFSSQRDRDQVYLVIISFLSVLAAAVLTTDAVFFASFCAFLLLAVSSFILMEMRRSSSRAATASQAAPSIPRSLFIMAVALAFAVGLVSSLIFFIMPRLSAGYMSAYASRNTLVSGFSNDVRLGEIGQIQQSDAVVMHIQIDGDTRGTHNLKWRGVALRVFDGARWTNPLQETTALNNREGNFDLSTTRAASAAAIPQQRVRYRVLMEPLGTNVFFLAARPQSLSGNYRMIMVDEGGAVYNGDREHAIGSYRAVSEVSRSSPDELRRADANVPPEVGSQYLQLPPLDPRVQGLARDIAARAPTPYDKAIALQHFLQANYAYTLQLPKTPQPDPMAHFLFERKAGHCEYFASAMALMLRTLGIPARVVNGFRRGEVNSVTGSYIVRGRDAHSWVEAYFPAHGWIDFDPTPAGGTPSPGAWNRPELYLDAIREFWREWVINYDFEHQMSLSNTMRTRSRQLLTRMHLWAGRLSAGLLQRARETGARAEESPWRFGGLMLFVIAVAIALLNVGRLRRLVRARRLVRNPGRAPSTAAAIWYSRMLRRLGRRGWRKLPEHTPKEFVRSIGDAKLRRPVAAFTDHYEKARFGNSAQDAEALPHVYEELRKS